MTTESDHMTTTDAAFSAASGETPVGARGRRPRGRRQGEAGGAGEGSA